LIDLEGGRHLWRRCGHDAASTSEFVSHLGDACLVHAAAVPGNSHKVSEYVGRTQHQLDDLRRSLQFARAHAVERGLEGMGEADEIVEAKGASSTLDRMDRTEDGVYRLEIAFLTLDREQAVFHLCELFLAFLEECL